jgi:hypothetical protein
MTTNQFAAVATVLCAAFLTACAPDALSPGERITAVVVPDTIRIVAFENKQLHAEVQATSKKVAAGITVQWASEDTSIAVVTASGSVVGVSVGRTRLIARAVDLADTATLVVGVPLINGVRYSVGDTLILGEVSQLRLEAVVLDGIQRVVRGVPVTFASDDTTIVSVRLGNLAVARKQGRGAIHAIVEGKPLSELPVLVEPGWSDVLPGYKHSCALRVEGTAYCWGSPADGRLGNGMPNNFPVDRPTAVVGDVRFTELVVGEHSTCAVSNGRKVYCWGWNTTGLLGTGDRLNRSVPTQILDEGDFISVALGEDHACALRMSNVIACWGRNFSGVLGFKTSESFITRPTDVEGATLFQNVKAASLVNTCALDGLGFPLCWGARGTFEQQQPATSCDSTACYGPTRVAGIAPSLAAIDVAYFHTCGLSITGIATCWGQRSPTVRPVQTTLRFKKLGASTVYAESSCAISRDDDTGHCWLWDTRSQTLPNPVATPLPGGIRLKRIGVGPSEVCGVSTTNVGYCWSMPIVTSKPRRLPHPMGE